MCKTFSFYAAKTGDFYSLVDHTDAHSMIAEVFGLRDNDVSYYAENLAKGEFTPPEDTRLWSDLSKWALTVDEPEMPAWFDHEKARAYMERLIRPMFVTDERRWLVCGCWIFDGEKATARGVMNGRIVGVINGANLARADLTRADLAGAYLAGAYLARANLTRANLTRANLAGAYLAGADLAGANLAGADLTRADMAGADLTRADLAGADLAGAYLTRANLAGANLAGADLTRAKIHEGASLPAGWVRGDSGIITRKP